MKKYTILAAMLLSLLGGVYAQENGSGGAAAYAPEGGDLSGAILFGRGNFLNSGLIVPQAAGMNSYGWTVPGTAPYANVVDPNDNSVGNIVGVELRYFLQNNIALKLSGGGIGRNTPGRINIPGGYNDTEAGNATWIPAYEAVVADERLDANANLGIEYHFSSKYSRLFPYGGVTVPFYYARRTMYDPTVTSNPDGTEPQVRDIGARHAEMIGFGGQLVTGVDYYLMEGLYFGFEIKPVSYVYAYSTKFPAPGLETLQADTHTLSIFSQTFLKVGFRF